jgi:hypothetical protein
VSRLYDELPEHPTSVQELYKNWWLALTLRLPCVYCRLSAREFLTRQARHPELDLAWAAASAAGERRAQKLVYRLHQCVNEKLARQRRCKNPRAKDLQKRSFVGPRDFLAAVQQYKRFQAWNRKVFFVAFYKMLYSMCSDTGMEPERASQPSELRDFIQLTVKLLSLTRPETDTVAGQCVLYWQQYLCQRWPDDATWQVCAHFVYRWQQFVWAAGARFAKEWQHVWAWEEVMQWILESRANTPACSNTSSKGQVQVKAKAK